jgi:hypothetical protein
VIKKIVSLFILCTTAIAASAQYSIGLEAGVDWNKMHTDTRSLTYTNKIAENGFVVSIPVSYQINNWLSLRAAIMYLHKSYSYLRTGAYTGAYTTFVNTYLQLPLMGSVTFGSNKFKVRLNGGVYSAYWIRGKLKGKIPNIYNIEETIDRSGQITETFSLTSFNQKYSFNSHKDRHFELGLVGGLGASYNLNHSNGLIIEVNYFHSLTDQQKNYMLDQQKRLNRTFTFTLGYIYEFAFSGKNTKAHS